MKLAQFFGKNQLDEMQERTMLTIESRGFWLVWSLLLVVLLGEGLLGFTMREMAGTWAVFMISCVYIVAACLRAGLWSRNIKATIGANLVGSLIAGAVVGVFVFIKMSAYDAPLSIMLVGYVGWRRYCGGHHLRVGAGGTPALQRCLQKAP